jgi:hypothetical protein
MKDIKELLVDAIDFLDCVIYAVDPNDSKEAYLKEGVLKALKNLNAIAEFYRV